MFSRKYSSEEIIAGLLSFDKKVYRYLDKVYCPKVIAYVRKNSGKREDGEELYQDTVYKVYVNAEQGKYDTERGEFGAYFMTIAYRNWLDELRKRKRSPKILPVDEIFEQITDIDEEEQEEQEIYYRNVEKLNRCITKLTEEEQDMIYLFYFDKESLDIIAKKMKLTYSYARIKICRIRDKLRNMMLDDDSDIDLKLI